MHVKLSLSQLLKIQKTSIFRFINIFLTDLHALIRWGNKSELLAAQMHVKTAIWSIFTLRWSNRTDVKSSKTDDNSTRTHTNSSDIHIRRILESA